MSWKRIPKFHKKNKSWKKEFRNYGSRSQNGIDEEEDSQAIEDINFKEAVQEYEHDIEEAFRIYWHNLSGSISELLP